MPWQTGCGSANAILATIRVDLTTLPRVQEAREAMLHRHLYAHNVGVIDEQYIDDWGKLTSEDLKPLVALYGYPNQDCYWFRPLQRMNDYIEAIRKLVLALP